MAVTKPTIAVIGCGYVGLTLAAVLASAGFNVYAVETDPQRLGVIKQGRSFFYEAGADSLIAAAIKSGRLLPTDSYDEAIPASSIVFSCVGTPDNPDGSSNLTHIFDAATKALALMKHGTIFVQKSTVPVGTGAKLEKLFEDSGKIISYVSCPEFSREGTAIGDTLWFDRVVAGGRDRDAARKVLDLHTAIERRQGHIAQLGGLAPPNPLPAARYLIVSLSSAELIKVTANAFLALKISFANSIAKLADRTAADIAEVMDGVGSDPRIGQAYLTAGRGYGGGCFPKDVSGLIHSAEAYGVDIAIMRAAAEVNDSMPHYVISKARAAIGGSSDDNVFKDKRIAVLGLSFKAGTSDVRRSPAVVITNTLAQQGALVRVYDPAAMAEAKPRLDPTVAFADSLVTAVKNTDCIFVATDWPEFLGMDLVAIGKLSGAKVFVDCTDHFDTNRLAGTTLLYVGVGKS